MTVAAETSGEIEFVDDGAGMSSAVLDRVFEPFFSTKSRERGLGMAIVRAIVNRHRGRMAVESVPLRGTEVRIQLPDCESREPRDRGVEL